MMPQSWIGKTLGGRYQIETLIGQGGMSAVYRASDPNLRRLVAIKMIHTHLSSDPNFIGRFKEEATAVARLRHPNIVQVHDFNVDGETYYMVMEYLVGETLQARLKRLNTVGRKMPLDEALRLCLQVCDAAGYAHDHELVHRDIKPANIMLDIHGQAILMDFGIVKIIGGDYHTATGATLGTAMYMSPEQIRSERVDERADIYSLGVTLYEMISGKPPYLADSVLTLMMMVLNDPLPDLRETRSDLPESLLKVVEKALAKGAADRFQSTAEMTAALRSVQLELTRVPSAPVVTVIDEPPVDEIIPSPELPTIPEDHPIEHKLKQEKVPPTEIESPPSPQPSPVARVNSEMTIKEISEQASTVQPKTRKAKAKPVVKLTRPRILILSACLLVLIVIISAVLYSMTFIPPKEIMSRINPPPEPITIQNAPAIVNLGIWELDAYIEEIAFSPDGNLLGTVTNRDWVRLSKYRHYSSLRQVGTGILGHHLLGQTQYVYDGRFSPDGKLFGSVSESGSLMLWQVGDGILVREILSDHGGLTSLAFSPNNLLIAAGSWDGKVTIWEIQSGDLLRNLEQSEFSIKDLDFSPDGFLLAAASDNNSVLVWNVRDGTLILHLEGHREPVYKVAFSPDGTRIASASEDHTVILWQLDGTPVKIIEDFTDVVYDVAFSPDGSLLATGSADGKIHLFQATDGRLLSQVTEYFDSIKSVAFSPDSFLLASGAADGFVHFWGISAALLP